MAEGSDALLDQLDRVTKDEFDAKMLGRVGRGQLTEVKCVKRTVRWHVQEMCSSWSGGTRHVTELAVLLGLTDTRAATKTRTPGTKATGVGVRDALEPLDTFQAATKPEHTNSSDSIQSSSAAQLSMSSLSRAERLSCMPQVVQQLEGCRQCSC